MSGSGRIGPGTLFASDYRIERVLCAERPDRCYVAVESKGGRRVRIVELPASLSLPWTTAAVEHAALAELLAVLTVGGSNFGVFAEVEGPRLSAGLQGGALGANEAVRIALRVAEGLTVMHRAGLVHAAVAPDNVVVDLAQPGSAILVPGPASQLPPGYRAPDRLSEEPGAEDDLWATGALLYEMLTANAPPEAGVSAPEQLEDAGIEEEVIGGIVAQALAADPNRRSARIASMRHPLRCWLERHARQPESAPGSKRTYAWSRAVLPSSRPPPPRRDSEAPELEVGEGHLSEPPRESHRPDAPRDSHRPMIEIGEGHLSEPPPPEGDAPPPSGVRESVAPSNTGAPRKRVAPSNTPAEPPQRSSRARWIGLAAVGIVLGGAAVLLLGHTSRSPRVAPGQPTHAAAPQARSSRTPAPSAHVHEPAAPPLPSASAAPGPAAPAAPADESIAACVARHLPALSFAKTPDMDWLCEVGDPRPGAQRLHGAVVRASNGRSITPAMQLWSPLTWYGMAEFAVLRGACCPDAAPLKLPPPSAGCQSMAEVLNQLATQVSEAANPTPTVQAFGDAVGCELRHHRQVTFWQKGRPGGGEAHDFEKLLESAMHPRSTP